MEIQKIREAVNPVFNTAKACTQLIAAAGDEDAKKIIDVLEFPSFGTHMPEKLIPKEILDKVKQLSPAYTVLLESRFRTMNQLIGSRKDRQIVDLPCGYTPRGIHMSRQGRTYFGFDLPAVIDDISRAAESIIGKDNNIAYHAV
ncbi:MAG: hypothetical protein IJ583_13160, partial [Firmicutes bacterium]|nr:hypothetical protein [Bacillota bacterium]